MKDTYLITLRIKVDSEVYEHPLDWDWSTLLDMDSDDLEIIAGDRIRANNSFIVKEADPELERLLADEEWPGINRPRPKGIRNNSSDTIAGGMGIISSDRERDRQGWAQERLSELRPKRSKGPKKRKRG